MCVYRETFKVLIKQKQLKIVDVRTAERWYWRKKCFAQQISFDNRVICYNFDNIYDHRNRFRQHSIYGKIWKCLSDISNVYAILVHRPTSKQTMNSGSDLTTIFQWQTSTLSLSEFRNMGMERYFFPLV